MRTKEFVRAALRTLLAFPLVVGTVTAMIWESVLMGYEAGKDLLEDVYLEDTK